MTTCAGIPRASALQMNVLLPAWVAEQSVFGCDFINTFISLVVGFPYRLVDFCQFAQLFQVIVHLLVADDGQSHVILEMDVLVFVQYGFAVFVQFNRQAVGSLDCGYFDVVGLHIASFQIANIRIPQTRKAAEQENITHTFQVLLILGYLVVFQLVQFIPSQEDYFFRGGFSVSV